MRRALAKSVDDRFQTATDMHEAILDYLFENRVRVSARKLSTYIKERIPQRAPPPESSLDPEALAPAASASEPVESASQPVEPAPQPVESASQPVEPAPQPVDSAPQPVESAPQPVEPAPQPVESEHLQPAPDDDVGYHEELEDPTPVDDAVAIRAAAAEASAPASPPAAVLPPGFDYERATFKVRNDLGEVFGPIAYHNFRSLIESRAITFREQISVDEGGWLRLGDLKIPGLDPRHLEDEPEQPLYEGPISRIRTPQLLYELAISRVIGKLKMTSGSTLKEIYFQGGVPVHINSNIKSELLANFMLNKNLIRPAQLNAALDMVKDKGGRLGAALVGLGLLKPHDLFRVVEFQFRQRFLQLFSWEAGWYEFLEGYPPPGDVVPINDGTVQLIAAGIRTQFDMGSTASPPAAVGSYGCIRWRASDHRSAGQARRA